MSFRDLFGKRKKPAKSGPDYQLEELTRTAAQAGGGRLPGYLLYPYDPIIQQMLEGDMVPVRNMRCGYQFKLYTAIADPTPLVRQNASVGMINEAHIFWKQGSPSWYTLSTMRGPAVATSPLRGWVEHGYKLGLLMGDLSLLVNLPPQLQGREIQNVEMSYLGQNPAYNHLHVLEESHVYAHVFSLGGTLYKNFILCAKREITSWKVECAVPAQYKQIMPPDFVPPGQTFGSFFPLLP